MIWYYDTLDIAPYLKPGKNEIQFAVLRYFACSRGAMAFERTALPGLTIVGHVEAGAEPIDLGSHHGWTAYPDESVQFPSGLVDDVFLHVSAACRSSLFSTLIASSDQRAHYSDRASH